MPIRELDHLLTYVRDGAAAERVYRALGFTLSPISHIVPMGIVNRLVLFADAAPGAANFIELMAVSDASKLPPPMAALLRGDEGIKSLVLSTDDAANAHAHLSRLGYPFAPPVRVERDWDLGDGMVVTPRFDVLLPVRAGLTFNVCHYHTPELYQRPAWTTHANGVTGISAVIAVVGDPAATATRFAAILGVEAEARIDGVRVLRRGRVALELHPCDGDLGGLSAVGGAEGYIGCRLRCPDVRVVRRHAAAAALPTRMVGPRLVVDAATACGTMLVFEVA
jgi:hypothetical protein